MNRTSIAISGLATALCLAATSGLKAQSLVATDASVLAWSEGPVNGLPPGEHFAFSFEVPSLAEDGTVLFRAQMEGGSITLADSRALFQGTTAANLSMLARWSGPAPGLPGFSLINSGGTQGIGSGSRLSPDGRTLWPSFVSGTGSTTANDSALFGGLPGSLTLVAREGAPAPGTAGAVYSGNFSTSSQYMAINRNGRVVFQAGLSGGDTTPANSTALFTGPIGAVGMMLRLGDTMINPGITFAGGTNIQQMDNNGRVLFDATLAGPGIAPSNNWSLWLHTPGAGRTLLLWEGGNAPGTAGATFNNAADNWQAGLAPSAFTRSGKYLFTSELLNGDAVSGVNDRALYTASTGGGSTLVSRSGDPAPGTSSIFFAYHPINSSTNDAGRVLIQAQIAGGSATDNSNNNGYWTGTPGNLVLVARAGDPAPGTQGARFGPLMGQSDAFNDLGQIVFLTSLVGGDAKANFNDRGIYAWDPVKGLFLLGRAGEQLDVAPGVTLRPINFGFVRDNNTDGAAQGFGKNGTLAFSMTLVPQGGAIAKVDLNCYPVYYPDADHDGYGDASSMNGVCSNASPPAGSAPNHTDCNDANPAIHAVYYRDLDGDGYGNASVKVCDDATPPAGYVPYGTDCSDANPAIHPDGSDESCNAVDDNCNGLADEQYGGFQGLRESTCGFGACAGTGTTLCSNGVVVVMTPCVTNPGNASPETCNNGIDDDCDGTVDDPVPTGTPTVGLSRIPAGASLNWTAVVGATGYDVVRGNLLTLRSTQGNFSTATTNCLGNNLAAITVNDNQTPAAGQGFWYVLRATNCGGASYDSGSPKQVGSRDAEIAASGNACP